jgi:hypothetical protein
MRWGKERENAKEKKKVKPISLLAINKRIEKMKSETEKKE